MVFGALAGLAGAVLPTLFSFLSGKGITRKQFKSMSRNEKAKLRMEAMMAGVKFKRSGKGSIRPIRASGRPLYASGSKNYRMKRRPLQGEGIFDVLKAGYSFIRPGLRAGFRFLRDNPKITQAGVNIGKDLITRGANYIDDKLQGRGRRNRMRMLKKGGSLPGIVFNPKYPSIMTKGLGHKKSKKGKGIQINTSQLYRGAIP
jgi:hypothetical protein